MAIRILGPLEVVFEGQLLPLGGAKQRALLAQVRQTFAAGNDPEGLAFADESLWVTNELDATLRRIDPRTGETSLGIPVGHAVEEVAVANGLLFVAVRGP